MRGIYLDIEHNDCKVVDIPNELEVFYSMLNCRCIEMPERKIGGKPYTIICDEEGLLKDSPKPSAFNHEHSPMLFGNLIIFNIDMENCDIKELSVDDCEHIVQFIRPMQVTNILKNETYSYLCLADCEF